MNNVLKMKLKKRFLEIARDGLAASEGEIDLDRAAADAVDGLDFSEYSAQEVFFGFMRSAFETEAKTLARPVAKDRDGETQLEMEFTDAWLDSGFKFGATFVKKRFANHIHNRHRLDAVRENRDRVNASSDREEYVFGELDKAYSSGASITNNEDAVAWLKDNE